MQNMSMEVKGSKLIIEIDIKQRGEKSKSGKSISIATTGGNISVPGHEEIKVGLNVYTPVK